MVKAKAKGAEPKSFTLGSHQSETVRSSLAAEPSAVEMTWRRLGAEIGFDPATIAALDVPEDGLVTFTAQPAEPSAAFDNPGNAPPINGEAEQAPAAPEDDDGFEAPDADEQLSAEMAKMERLAIDAELESGTLASDVAHTLLEIVKIVDMPWTSRSQHQKRDLATHCEKLAAMIVARSVDVVAGSGRESVKAVLDKIAIGDKTTVGLTLASMPDDQADEAIQALFHCKKKTVLIVTADRNAHMTARKGRQAVPDDEEQLPFDAGSDAPEDQQSGDGDDDDLPENSEDRQQDDDAD